MNFHTTELFKDATPQRSAMRSHQASGAANLVENCVGDVAGKTVLVICEDPKYGWYDAAAPASVCDELTSRGAIVRTMVVGLPENQPNAEVQAAMNRADRVIFFSRLGDQGRFNWHYTGPPCVMSYALDENMLESGYGRLDHHAMRQMKIAIDEVTLHADNIIVTCRRGTHFEGRPAISGTPGNDVIINRFPIGIPQPVLNDGFHGKAVLANYLTPTGSKVYDQECLQLTTPVTAHFDRNRITGFTGEVDMVAAVEAHYARIAAQFDIDAYNIDSWHAGIHPSMNYDRPASADPLRWSGTVFQNQRLLHFHTCGSGPPGEICWMILDPTIRIDGVALWEDGRLHPERFAATNHILDLYPELADAYAAPATACGLES